MDSISEFISSGIIELYCLGLTSEEETAKVVQMATQHKAVRDEIEQVNEALCSYAASLERKPAVKLRGQVLKNFDIDTNLPARLYENSSVEYWNKYLADHQIAAPADFDPLHLADLPSNDKQITYAVWAKTGANVEETHDDEDEWLFILRGTCTMTINGKVSHHKAGDLISIPHNHLHKAEATSDDMILIGQRLAA